VRDCGPLWRRYNRLHVLYEFRRYRMAALRWGRLLLMDFLRETSDGLVLILHGATGIRSLFLHRDYLLGKIIGQRCMCVG